jgi:omega-6 fatty acid desaturase (delta-12 desaturase)
LNVIVTQPLSAETAELGEPCGEVLRKAAGLRSAVNEGTKPSKTDIRRLAAYCNTFRGADTRQAVRQLLSTLIPLALLIAGMFAAVHFSAWLALLLAIPAGGLLVRAFIIQHDCGHGSFFSSRRLNDFTGRCMSVLTLTPYNLWRREHAQHHATSGNLDKRGAGDIDTLTVEEYLALSWLGRLRYRIYRNPLFLFGIGVPIYFVLIQRLPWLHAIAARQAWKSVLGLNAALAAFYGPLFYFFGFGSVLLVMLPIVHIASATGGWLFFIQHQFEKTTWEKAEGWDFQVAAMLGSSFYDLPKGLNWLTGNIGLHHIHHLNSMIPNYKLPACLNGCPELKVINRLTLRESWKCASLKLWDAKRSRLIRFDEIELPA